MHIFINIHKNISISRLFLALIILTFPFLIKYVFVAHNQYEQLPIILRHLDSSYLANDWSTNLTAQFSPRIFFTLYMGVWARFFSLPVIYFLHYLFTIACIASATYLFTRRMIRSPIAALLTTVAVLYGQKITLGGNDLVGRDFDPSRPAFSLVILSFVLLLSKRFYTCAIIFAASAYLHPLIGFEAPFVFYVSFFISIIITRQKRVFKQIVKSVLLYLLLVLPAVVIYIISYLRQQFVPISSMDLMAIVTTVVSPFHYKPSTWPVAAYLKFTLLLLLFFIFHRLLKKRLDKYFSITVCSVIILILLLCAVGFIFTEFVPIYNIAVAQFFRLTVIVYWISSCTVYGYCFHLLLVKGKRKHIFGFILGLIPFILATHESVLKLGGSYLLFLTISIFVVLFIMQVKTLKIAYFGVAVSVVAFSLLYRHYTFHFNKMYPFETPENNIAQWVRLNTQKDSVFLTPPDFIRFRLIAKRAIIVDRLVLPFDNRGIYEWLVRMKDISGIVTTDYKYLNEDAFYRGYRNINANRIEDLKIKYNLDYAVVEKGVLLPYSILYNDNYFTIYDLKQTPIYYSKGSFLNNLNDYLGIRPFVEHPKHQYYFGVFPNHYGITFV